MYAIITQAKDQSERLKDWILYHYEEGFDTFIYFDDYSEDNSILLLRKLSEKYNINIIINYTDGIGNKKSLNDLKNSNSYAGDTSINYRIIRSYNMGTKIARDIKPESICAYIDVDEFIVTNENKKVSEIISDFIKGKDHIYVHSFDVSDEFELKDWYACDPTTSKRWSYESRKNTIYKQRGKSISIASTQGEIPQESNYVHVLKEVYNEASNKYMKSRFDEINMLDFDKLRIHHFRKPKMKSNIIYIDDFTLINKMKKIKEKYEQI